MAIFDWIVLGFAVVLLLFATRGWTRHAVAAPGSGVQEFVVHHDAHGFRPNVLLVKPGIPVRIRFSGGGAATVVIPHWGIRRRISALRKITVDLVPTSAGRYRFFGAEDAKEGKIVVVASSRGVAAWAPARR